MLSLRLIRRGVTQYFKQSSKLHTSLKLLSAKDPQDSTSSSSSDSSSSSSDSDSDNSDKNIKKEVKTQSKSDDQKDNISDTQFRLNSLLQSMVQPKERPKEAKINIAIKPKKVRLAKQQEPKPEKEKPFEQQLTDAAKNVAKTLKGDPKKNELELLSKVLNMEQQSEKSDENLSPDKESKDTTHASDVNLSDLLSNMKVDASSAEKKRIYNKQEKLVKIKQEINEQSISRMILNAKTQKISSSSMASSSGPELNVESKKLDIFINLPEKGMKDNYVLSTWEAMEARELKLSQLTSPKNVFQELIQWTDQGKLWHFPINNEQGMEEENNVHFSEHVFLERHLKGWCPKRGPIRHFMELVCNGLSKNPYMTVQEKVGHITWYKNFFESKHDLLEELELLDTKAISSGSKSKANE